jgi:23S rRNA (cytosine1962-C5)-methyltransferase
VASPSAKQYRVSRATSHILRRGHPWILPDAESDDPGAFEVGSRVAVVGPRGEDLGLARMEGKGRIAARIWARPGVSVLDDEAEVRARVQKALAPRRGLARRGAARFEVAGRPHTSALRLVHAEADGLPGLAVDLLGDLLRILVSSPASVALVEPLLAALRESRDVGPGELPAVEVLHWPGPAPPIGDRVRWREEPDAPWLAERLDARGRLVVHERGLRFWVDPGLAEPGRARPGVGFFLDQRENRARLAAAARGGEWLNLFAHTGSFSVALLAAGARRVTSVDLSAAYLRWLDENLLLNREFGVDVARHESHRGDGRRFLSTRPGGEAFDGIVIDPPTAAAAGRRFWSSQRDLEPLIASALARLRPGGLLLVCHNARRGRGRLGEWVERAARSARVRLEALDPAGPGEDFPRRRAFPEGDAFEGVIAVRGPG